MPIKQSRDYQFYNQSEYQNVFLSRESTKRHESEPSFESPPRLNEKKRPPMVEIIPKNDLKVTVVKSPLLKYN